MARKIDWNSHVGERWGKLTIIRPVDVGRGRTGYECRCDCGNVKIVKVYQHMTSGKLTSCGCYKSEKDRVGHERMIKRQQERRDRYEAMQAEWARKRESAESARREREAEERENKEFREKNIRLYYCWQSMIQRCTRQTHHKYQLYGSRGIRVCDEWIHDFRAFAEWSLNNGYADDLYIDRIDDNGDYEPSNCRWVTKMVNNNNKRNNHYLRHKVTGEIHTLAEWARIEGIRYETLCEKLRRRGDRADYERVGYDEALDSRK